MSAHARQHAFQPQSPRMPQFVQRRVEHFLNEKLGREWGGRHIMRGRNPGVDAVRLTSNDYLALANHPEVHRAQAAALSSNSHDMLMSAVFLNGPNPQARFEAEMADLMGSERSIVSQSGWCANTGLMQAIAGPDVPVYIDLLAHMSLWEGATAARATAHAFLHNDVTHLEKMIAKHGPGVIVVDSVYSGNGSVAPLVDIAAVSTANDCVLLVDESHSLGTHGPEGAGLVAELGLSDQVHFRTASLAKAFASRAGIIATTAEFWEYFWSASYPAIFSSTLLPHELVGLSKTLEIVRRDEWRRESLRQVSAQLRDGLDGLGYNLRDSDSQIIALEAGTEPALIDLRDALEKRGVFGAPFFPPATPRNRAAMRLSIPCTLTPEEIDHVLMVCDEIRDEVGMRDWQSTRRKRRAPALKLAHST